jgi:hypothetical protein
MQEMNMTKMPYVRNLRRVNFQLLSQDQKQKVKPKEKQQDDKEREDKDQVVFTKRGRLVKRPKRLCD